MVTIACQISSPSAQEKPRRQIAEYGDIVEGVLHHDEGHAPEKRTGEKGAMRFEPETHRTDAARPMSGIRNGRPAFFRTGCMATPSLLIHCYKGNLRVRARIA